MCERYNETVLLFQMMDALKDVEMDSFYKECEVQKFE